MIAAAMPIAMRADLTSRFSTASKQFYTTRTPCQPPVDTYASLLRFMPAIAGAAIANRSYVVNLAKSTGILTRREGSRARLGSSE